MAAAAKLTTKAAIEQVLAGKRTPMTVAEIAQAAIPLTNLRGATPNREVRLLPGPIRTQQPCGIRMVEPRLHLWECPVSAMPEKPGTAQSREQTTRTIILAASALAAAFAIATAATAQPRAVTIEVKTPNTGGAGTFTTSGGGLCRRGATHDKIFTQPKAGNRWTLHFRKTFTCSNRAGAFVVEVRGHVTGAHASGGWRIVTGTGAYAKLEGSGSFAANGTATGFLDHYRGTIS